MKALKIVIFSALNLANLYCLYATIGYLILGINTPKILGDTPTAFMGMYIMSMTFGAIFLVLTALIIWPGVKFFRAKNR